ncbi:MAG TPA: hypothetical protein DIW31_05555 [Bacteroidales bacterium]|nr:hypothetical protein [Bacteroidales bacterium]
MKIGVFILLFIFGKPSDDEVTRYISCHVVGISFPEFAKSVYDQTGAKIFYDEESVRNIKITLDADSISIMAALEIVLKGSGIEISPWHNNFILLSGKKIMSDLPDFKLPEKEYSSSSETSKSSEKESQFLATRKTNTSELYKIGSKNANGPNAMATVNGKIIDHETGAPLVNATIIIEENRKGTVTDVNGSFSINIYPGNYNSKVECLGYEPKKIFFEILSNGELLIELNKKDLQIDELLIYRDKLTNVRTKEPGLELIAPKTIKQIPTMMGELDIINVSTLLPGIVNVGEGSSGLNVRGGSSDQNVFYIDKIPIYNTSHVFGFFPAFNSDIIKDFSIYKGYVPAQYGGRISSVFNIVSRQSNPKQFTAHGGINPISGYITAEGPLIKESLTLIMSARTSYSDWILSRIKDPTIRNSSAAFNDFSGSLSYKKEKSQLSMFIYNSNDRFSLLDINKYQYSNLGVSVNLKHNFSSSLKGEFAAINSNYSFETTDNQEVSAAYQHNYKIKHYEVRSDFAHTISGKTVLDYGASLILYKLDRGNVVPYGFSSLRSPVDLGKEQGIESAIYITDKYQILPQLNLSLGLRQSLFTPIGPNSVYTYYEGFPKEAMSIKDTINFKSNKPIKWFYSPEIRATINFQTDKNGSIKLAFNQMQQNLFMLNNTIAVAPNTQWKLADYHIKPSRSSQLSLGVFRSMQRSGLEASLEFYIKKTNNYMEFKDGASFLSSSATETSILQGVQKAYGIEFFFKSSGHKLGGWLSYTYSRTQVQVKGSEPWNSINEGKVYPSNFDIPHAVNAVINYSFNRRITLSTVTTYQTGKPVTYPISLYYINSIQQIEYSERNKYRIPDYFRVDLSLAIEGNLKKRKWVHSSLLIGIYNLTGRNNAYSVYYQLKNAKIKSYKYSVIGIPLITVTWKFKLGNYDAI